MCATRPRAVGGTRRAPTGIALTAGLTATLCLVAWPQASGAPREAARVEALAATAARQLPVDPLAPGQYRYRRWRGTTLASSVGARGSRSWLEYRTSEQWVASDGSGRWRSVCEAVVVLNPRGQAGSEAGGSSGAACPDGDQAAGPGELAPAVPLAAELGALPTDPARLEARLRAVGAPSGRRLSDGETFALLGELLQLPVAPPPLRGGLIRVAARLPGVMFAGPVRDPVGRPGIGLAIRVGSLRHELILSAGTSAVLAERTVVERRLDWLGVRPGHTLLWVAHLATARVGSTRERPRTRDEASRSASPPAGPAAD
jgi:hypothetical protein